MRYVVINPEGVIENIVLWDGITEWEHPKGYSCIKDDNFNIGGTLVNGVYTSPNREEDPEIHIYDGLPSIEEKFERLQAKLVEKAVITEAEKESISEPTLEINK